MTTERFKLPRSSYEELTKIIIAYGKSEGPQSLNQISQLTGIGTTSVSDNNSFLAAVGLIEGGKGKSSTQKCKGIARALEHHVEDEVARSWAAIIQENEFLTKVLQAISIRSGMDESQLLTHIAYSAGEPKTDAVTTGARTVIDILRQSRLVKDNEGHFMVAQRFEESRPENAAAASVRTGSYRRSRAEKSGGSDGPPSRYTFHVEIRINATPADLDGLGDKLNALRKSLEDSYQEADSDD